MINVLRTVIRRSIYENMTSKVIISLACRIALDFNTINDQPIDALDVDRPDLRVCRRTIRNNLGQRASAIMRNAYLARARR